MAVSVDHMTPYGVDLPASYWVIATVSTNKRLPNDSSPVLTDSALAYASYWTACCYKDAAARQAGLTPLDNKSGAVHSETPEGAWAAAYAALKDALGDGAVDC
jgi:hypothetical protein